MLPKEDIKFNYFNEPFNGLELQENGSYKHYKNGKEVKDNCHIFDIILCILIICNLLILFK